MPRTTIVIHPRQGALWPDGEPQSVRDRADELARARRDRLPVIPAPRQGDGDREPVRAGRGRR